MNDSMLLDWVSSPLVTIEGMMELRSFVLEFLR